MIIVLNDFHFVQQFKKSSAWIRFIVSVLCAGSFEPQARRHSKLERCRKRAAG
jgi:hypothetical protein